MYAEFVCPECKTNFELCADKDIQLDYIICVECGSPRVKCLASDQAVTSRLDKVIIAMKELIDRVEIVEDVINADIGPDTTSGKEQIN